MLLTDSVCICGLQGPKCMSILSAVEKARPSPHNQYLHLRACALYARAQKFESSLSLFGLELLYVHNAWGAQSFHPSVHARCVDVTR
jgi:hypothetical protein